jgi:DNA mismatch repair ATPase MutL
VRTALRDADLTRPVADTRFGAPSRGAGGFGLAFGSGADPQGKLGPGPAERENAAAFAEHVRGLREEAERAVRPVVTAEELASGERDPGTVADVDTRYARSAAAPDIVRAHTSAGPGRPTAEGRSTGRFVQVHDSYIVVEDEHGMVIIDQHALHERVMFETLCARLGLGGGAERSLESQRFLTPATAPAEPELLGQLDRLGPLLARLGVEAEALGPRTVGVHAFPTLLIERKVEPGAFVTELLARAHADDLPPNEEAALHEVLDMMACKAAVKAGDRLGETEIAALLEQRHAVERSAACPHGRPTSVRVTLAQLERLFERR